MTRISSIPNKEVLTNIRVTIETVILHAIIQRTGGRVCQYSNRIKMIWKQWYINRGKLNVKFKAISKHFDTFIERCHHGISFNKQKCENNDVSIEKQKRIQFNNDNWRFTRRGV